MEDSIMAAYEAEVVEVYSGDDLIVMVDLGVESLFKRQRVRLYGVDTPNAIGVGANTVAGEVRSYVRNLCKNKKLRIEVVSRGMNSWVVVAHVLRDGVYHNLNDDLIGQGYAFKREKVR